MSVLGAVTAAVLLAASPTASDAERLAANGGFLLGNAHRCGVATERVMRVGQLVRELIAAAAQDGQEKEHATLRFARFFLASAVVDPAQAKLVPSCALVSSEFAALEKHELAADAVNNGGSRKEGAATARGKRFRPGDGE